MRSLRRRVCVLEAIRGCCADAAVHEPLRARDAALVRPQGNAHRHEGPGWSQLDANGTALGHAYEGPRTTLHFVPAALAPSYELDLELAVQGEGEISATVNGAEVGSVAIHTGDVDAKLLIPGDVPAGERYLAIDLELDGDARVYARTVVLWSADDVNPSRRR